MGAVGSKITVAVDPPTAFVQVVGRAAVESSRDFKMLVQRLSGQGVEHFVLDLRECFLMDSTFSGVLAGLVSSAPAGGQAPRRFTLVQPNERVADLLDNLGVLPLVQQIDASESVPSAVSPETVSLATHSKAEVAACCLEAHRLLMALKPENVAKFRALEQVLVAQLDLGITGAQQRSD